jgi:hypothetical protein
MVANIMVTSMMANIKMIKEMEKVFIILLMVAKKNLFIKMIIVSAVNSYD